MSIKHFDRIQHLLRQAGYSGWLLYDFRGLNPIARRIAPLPDAAFLSRRWAYWIPAAGEPGWLVHAIERGQFSHLPDRVHSYASWQSFGQALLALTGGPGDIACEYSPDCSIPYISYVDAGTAEILRRLGYTLHASADLVQAAYATWTPAQLESHRRAARICLETKDAAFDLIGQRLRQGVPTSELDIVNFIQNRLHAGGLDTDHPAIVAVNENAGNPHYQPTSARHSLIQPGDLILIDLWGRVAGDPDAIFADMTWMAYAGQHPTAEMDRVFAIVAQARDAAIRFIQERVSAGDPPFGWEVDDVARGVITEAGYGEHFIHRTGHSLDSNLHGSGVNLDNLETRDTRRLIPRVGFTIEPGVYLSHMGVRLEINMYLHEDRAEVTTLPLQNAFITLL